MEELNKLENLEAGMGSKTYAMRDLEEHGRVMNGNRIIVKNHVTQNSRERV